MSDITERLALIIDGHTDGAVSAVRRLSLEEKAAADRAEVLQAKIADLNTRIARSATGGTNVQKQQLAKLNSEYNQLTSGLAKVPPLAGKAEKALSKMGLGGIVPGSVLGAASKALPGLAVGAAAFGGFEFLKKGIQDYEQLAAQIRAVQLASGASAEDASRLVAITKTLGLNADDAALGMFRLARNIALTPQKLTDFNVTIARTSTGNVDLMKTLDNVATAYQHTQDPARRAALVYQAFGRAGATMLPILNANREQLDAIAKNAQKQGLIFSSEDLQRARELQIATREMKDAVEGLAISASKTLVPALTTAAEKANEILTSTPAKKAGNFLNFLANFPYNYEPSSNKPKPSEREKAIKELQAQQTQAAHDALSQAALATLASPFDTLAGPQAVASAKQSLTDAKNQLISARAERDKARAALNAARTGGSHAGATQIEAATARVAAAQANYNKALYLGGDARIAGAKATLLTDQARLNTLRAQGGVNTTKLADATERLRRANVAVTAAQAKAKAAQKTANDATGLSAGEVLARITGQVKDQQGLAGANVKLASAGLAQGVIAELDDLNKQIPGTLAKVAGQINGGLVAKLNDQQSALESAQQEYADAAANPGLFKSAGQAAGNSFVTGFNDTLKAGLPSYQPAVPARLPKGFNVGNLAKLNGGGVAGLSAAFGGGGVVINVGTVTSAAKTGAQLANELARHARHRSLTATP